MATRKKVKRKTKPKRKKAPVTKTTTRGKATTVRKKPAKKTLVRSASPKKARPTSNAAAKPTPISPLAQRGAATPTPSPSAQFAPPGDRIGVVTHYYGHLSVATLRLESGTLRVGDVIHIHGHTTDFSQQVDSLEVNHSPATEVGPNDDFGLKVVGQVREHDVVYKVRR
jgi:translation elongation factor EF-Tu-like GTPase